MRSLASSPFLTLSQAGFLGYHNKNMSGKETLKIIDRFVLKHKLGQGTFSKLILVLFQICAGYIYEAFDKHL
jgi:hypothetical protein